MFEKLGAIINLFRKGSEVSNVEAWKTGGISVAALSAALGALVQFGDAFGVHIKITPDQVNGLAIGVIALVGVVLPAITSKRAGLLPAKTGEPAPGQDHPVPDPMPAVPKTVARTPLQQPPVATARTSIWDNPNNPGG